MFTLQLNVYTVVISSVNKIVTNEWLRFNNSGFLIISCITAQHCCSFAVHGVWAVIYVSREFVGVVGIGILFNLCHYYRCQFVRAATSNVIYMRGGDGSTWHVSMMSDAASMPDDKDHDHHYCNAR
jgi:hypothetical protein